MPFNSTSGQYSTLDIYFLKTKDVHRFKYKYSLHYYNTESSKNPDICNVPILYFTYLITD